MLDETTIYKIIKEAGYLPVNITDGLTNAKTVNERKEYLSRRQNWAASRPKVVLIVSRNESTIPLLFTPIDSNVRHVPAHIYLFSKRGGFSVVPNAGPLPIVAFVKGLTARCLDCQASTVMNGLTCSGCGYSQCKKCYLQSPVVDGIKCKRCQQLTGNVDIGSTMMAILAAKQRTDSSKSEPYKITVTSIEPSNGEEGSTAFAKVNLPRRQGDRKEETQLCIDPNMACQPGNDTMLVVCQTRGLTMAQPIIDAYCQRLKHLEEASGAPCPNVVMCLIGGNIETVSVTTLGSVKDVLETISQSKQLRLVYKQGKTAWKTAEKSLQRNLTTGTYGFVACCFFPGESSICVELFIVHEIAKDMLVLTNGWICAKCQKPAARKRCSRCGVMRYCSEECYTSHWSIHQGLCDTFVTNKMLLEAMNKAQDDM